MLYIYFGPDVNKVHAVAYKAITSLRTRKPDASFYKIESEQTNEQILDELIQSQGLFEQKYIIQLNQVFENNNTKDIVMDRLKEIRGSQNIFIITEHKLTASIQKKLKKYAHKMQEFSVADIAVSSYLNSKTISKNTFNIFSLADALGDRNKKRLWILLQKAYFHNIPAEEIHGTLMWQVKMMLIAKQVDSVDKTSFKPYVFNKAKRFSLNYSINELRDLSERFVSIYHNVRIKGASLSVSLEQLILEL